MAEQEKRLSPLAVLGDGALLLCALGGLAGSFLSLYGDWGAASSARPTALDLCQAHTDVFVLAAQLFALAALAAWSAPRFRWAAVGALGGLWAWAALLRWREAAQGAGLTAAAITRMFAGRVSWGRALEYDPGLTLYQEGEAVRLFLLLALAGLALALGWAVVRARRWWLVLALTLPPLLPGLLADLYPHWPSFMALSACWCAMLLTDLCKWAAPGRRGALTAAALPAAGLALLGLTLALPREGYTRPAWALRAEERLSAAGESLSERFFQGDGPFRAPVTYMGAAQEADLASAGPLRYTGRTVLMVESGYEGRLYLWGSALGRYENGRWTELGEEAYQEYLDALEAAGAQNAPTPLAFPALYLNSVEAKAISSQLPAGEEYAVTVSTVGTSSVFAPYQLLDQDWAQAGVMPVRDSYLAHRPGLPRYTLAFTPPGFGPSGARVGILEERVYRSYVQEHYLDVEPEWMGGFLRALYNDNYHYKAGDGFPGPLTYAWRIGDILEKLCEYDPNVPAPPEGTDPVLYFLTGSRRGYCMHFASAATLMLRSLGVPARYVQGYTVQTEPGRQVSVPDYAAHAWVEVYVDGYGWYPVEVTPAAAFDHSAASGEEGGPAPTRTPGTGGGPTPTPEAEPTQAPGPALPEGEDGPGGTGDRPGTLSPALVKAMRAAALAAGIGALAWLGQWLPKRLRARRLAGADHSRAALYGYRCLLRLRRWGGRVDGRAEELAQKARFSRHALTQEEGDEARALVDAERARLCASLPPVRRAAFLYLWGGPQAGKNAGKSPKNSP